MKYIIYESAISSSLQDVKLDNSNVVRFVATLQEADVKNRNGRIYPKQVIESGLQSTIIQEKLRTHTLFGECGHPYSQEVARQTNVDMRNAAFMIEDFWWEGNLLKAHCKTLDTALGRDMAGLIREGCILSFSMRGQGNVINDPIRGAKVVQAPLMIITYDWVYLPSHDKAYMENVCEETKQSMFNTVAFPSMSMALSESCDLYENGKLLEVAEDNKEKPMIDYCSTYAKPRKLFSEMYIFNKNDKVVEMNENYVILENDTNLIKVAKEDYLLKSIRNTIIEDCAPADCARPDATKELSPEVKDILDIKQDVDDVEPIENSDEEKEVAPKAETALGEDSTNEALPETQNPIEQKANDLGLGTDGVSGDSDAENVLTPEKESELDNDSTEEFNNIYNIVKDESNLSDKKEICKVALKYSDMMSESCKLKFENILKGGE